MSEGAKIVGDQRQAQFACRIARSQWFRQRNADVRGIPADQAAQAKLNSDSSHFLILVEMLRLLSRAVPPER